MKQGQYRTSSKLHEYETQQPQHHHQYHQHFEFHGFQSMNKSQSNDYVRALSQLQKPTCPSRGDRLLGAVNDIKIGIHNSKTLEKGHTGQQIVNAGSTLNKVRRHVFNSEYKQQRREYRRKQKSLKKLAKLENKRLKYLNKQGHVPSETMSIIPQMADHSGNEYQSPLGSPSEASFSPDFNSSISPYSSQSSSVSGSPSYVASHRNSEYQDYKEPPPPPYQED